MGVEQDVWSGPATVSISGREPFTALTRVWAVTTPRPLVLLRVDLSGDVDGVPQLFKGPASVRLGGSGYAHAVLFSRVSSHAISGRFNGEPPAPTGEALAIEYSILNLDPATLWLEEMTADGWRFCLTAVERDDDAPIADVGIVETHTGTLDRTNGTAFDVGDGMQH